MTEAKTDPFGKLYLMTYDKRLGCWGGIVRPQQPRRFESLLEGEVWILEVVDTLEPSLVGNRSILCPSFYKDKVALDPEEWL